MFDNEVEEGNACPPELPSTAVRIGIGETLVQASKRCLQEVFGITDAELKATWQDEEAHEQDESPDHVGRKEQCEQGEDERNPARHQRQERGEAVLKRVVSTSTTSVDSLLFEARDSILVVEEWRSSCSSSDPTKMMLKPSPRPRPTQLKRNNDHLVNEHHEVDNPDEVEGSGSISTLYTDAVSEDPTQMLNPKPGSSSTTLVDSKHRSTTSSRRRRLMSLTKRTLSYCVDYEIVIPETYNNGRTRTGKEDQQEGGHSSSSSSSSSTASSFYAMTDVSSLLFKLGLPLILPANDLNTSRSCKDNINTVHSRIDKNNPNSKHVYWHAHHDDILRFAPCGGLDLSSTPVSAARRRGDTTSTGSTTLAKPTSCAWLSELQVNGAADGHTNPHNSSTTTTSGANILSSLLVGIENTAPQQKSPFAGVSHGTSGKSNTVSARGSRKWDAFEKVLSTTSASTSSTSSSASPPYVGDTMTAAAGANTCSTANSTLPLPLLLQEQRLRLPVQPPLPPFLFPAAVNGIRSVLTAEKWDRFCLLSDHLVDVRLEKTFWWDVEHVLDHVQHVSDHDVQVNPNLNKNNTDHNKVDREILAMRVFQRRVLQEVLCADAVGAKAIVENARSELKRGRARTADRKTVPASIKGESGERNEGDRPRSKTC
ncbi:unnamed protein product [Amoebophrya sp. A25]|nr:unnamed protein product [Amoebophrya sp. A25]|eukprot:GSA25T00004709001.1